LQINLAAVSTGGFFSILFFTAPIVRFSFRCFLGPSDPFHRHLRELCSATPFGLVPVLGLLFCFLHGLPRWRFRRNLLLDLSFVRPPRNQPFLRDSSFCRDPLNSSSPALIGTTRNCLRRGWCETLAVFLTSRALNKLLHIPLQLNPPVSSLTTRIPGLPPPFCRPPQPMLFYGQPLLPAPPIPQMD